MEHPCQVSQPVEDRLSVCLYQWRAGICLALLTFPFGTSCPLSVCFAFQINGESYLWERTFCSKPLLEHSGSRLCCFAK